MDPPRMRRTFREYLAAALMRHPECWTPPQEAPADQDLWPLYVYASSPHVETLWGVMAEQRGVPYYPRVEALESANAELNASSHEALRSGVVWIQKEREFTSRERLIGVTFHPGVARENVYLTTPQQWHELHHRLFPAIKLEALDAERTVTYTIEDDKADYSRMTRAMRQAVLRLERGIESGVPQDTPVNPDAFRVLSPEYMQMFHVIPFRLDPQARVLSLFMTDVDDDRAPDLIYRNERLTVKKVHMDPEDEAAFWAQYHAANAVQDEEEEQDPDLAPLLTPHV